MIYGRYRRTVEHITKVQEKTLEDKAHVHHLDSDDGVTVYTYVKTL